MHLPHNERTVASHEHKTKEEPRRKKEKQGWGCSTRKKRYNNGKWRERKAERKGEPGYKKGRLTQEEKENKKKKKKRRRWCERVREASPLLSEAAKPIHLQFLWCDWSIAVVITGKCSELCTTPVGKCAFVCTYLTM